MRDMHLVNIHAAKTNLSSLIATVLGGDEVIIGKAGKPVAKLVAYKKSIKPRKPGQLKGKIIIPDDFSEESDEINEMFYG